MDPRNKVILITGASSGIGYSLAVNFLQMNCKLILLARRSELMSDLLVKSKVSDERGIVLKCDVTDQRQVRECITAGYKKFGRIDISILNSGTSHRTRPGRFDTTKGKEIMDVNFYGAVNCLEVLLPLMQKQDRSIIAGVSSLSEGRGFPKSGFYAASKAALSILLESLRIELSGTGIKIITIKPGFVRTPMTDKNEFRMPFLMEPDEAAKIIIRGIEKESRIIQFPFLTVMGAKILKLLPDTLFDWMARKHLAGLSEKM